VIVQNITAVLSKYPELDWITYDQSHHRGLEPKAIGDQPDDSRSRLKAATVSRIGIILFVS